MPTKKPTTVRKRKKMLRLICKCGMKYSLSSIDDLRYQCIVPTCNDATLKKLKPKELWDSHEAIKAIINALAEGRDYRPAVKAARDVSRRIKSPHTIAIVRVP
jgi:hypothetical protein